MTHTPMTQAPATETTVTETPVTEMPVTEMPVTNEMPVTETTALTMSAARVLKGEVTVPGERTAAATTLVLAALADGESRLLNMPPGIEPLVQALRQLGIEIERSHLTAVVKGRGLRGFQATDGVVDLSSAGLAAPLLGAALAGHGGEWTVRAGDQQQRCAQTLSSMTVMGVRSAPVSAGSDGGAGADGVYTISATVSANEPGTLTAAVFAEEQSEASVELALLVAGLYGDGDSVLPLPIRKLDRADHQVRAWGVEVTGSKAQDGKRVVSIAGGQQIQPREVEISGDLELAAPLLTAAASVKGSKVRIRNVVIRPENRTYLDLMRQIGAQIDIEEDQTGSSNASASAGDGAVDLVIKGSAQLKATRVADKRAEKLLDQVSILAVLATQTEGEFLIRDIEQLRDGETDAVIHLAETLRLMEAKVGEFPEGLVIDGGHPLKGARVDARGDSALAQALAVAGLLASGETQIDGTDSVATTFPGFFEALRSLRQKGKKR